MQVFWKSGSRFKADPVLVEAELARIRSKHGDATPELVLEAAKSKRSAMHGEFEWDDAKAAHEYRMNRARKILHSIEVIHDERKPQQATRLYEVVKVPTGEGNKTRNVYRTVDEIMSDPDTRAELLSRALRELVAWQRRYRNLQELASVFRAAAEAQETIQV